jgi:cytosine/adenosine deaminase-related metal-dependent hydrolase
MKTPIKYLEDLGALDLKPLLIHGVEVDEDDICRIKVSGSSVVHCPRSNHRLRCRRMPLEDYLAQGVPVYLGTDSLASSPSLNVWDDVEFAAKLHEGKVPREAIEKLARQPLTLDDAF